MRRAMKTPLLQLQRAVPAVGVCKPDSHRRATEASASSLHESCSVPVSCVMCLNFNLIFGGVIEAQHQPQEEADEMMLKKMAAKPALRRADPAVEDGCCMS